MQQAAKKEEVHDSCPYGPEAVGHFRPWAAAAGAAAVSVSKDEFESSSVLSEAGATGKETDEAKDMDIDSTESSSEFSVQIPSVQRLDSDGNVLSQWVRHEEEDGVEDGVEEDLVPLDIRRLEAQEEEEAARLEQQARLEHDSLDEEEELRQLEAEEAARLELERLEDEAARMRQCDSCNLYGPMCIRSCRGCARKMKAQGLLSPLGWLLPGPVLPGPTTLAGAGAA